MDILSQFAEISERRTQWNLIIYKKNGHSKKSINLKMMENHLRNVKYLNTGLSKKAKYLKVRQI